MLISFYIKWISMESQDRLLFNELYEHAIYIVWLIGIFIGIHILSIYNYSPTGISEVPSRFLIASHTHILLMTAILFFLNRGLTLTLNTRGWPEYWTEGVLVLSLVGAVLTSLEFYFLDAANYGGQLQLFSYIDMMRYGGVSWGSTFYALGMMGYIVCAMIAKMQEEK